MEGERLTLNLPRSVKSEGGSKGPPFFLRSEDAAEGQQDEHNDDDRGDHRMGLSIAECAVTQFNESFHVLLRLEWTPPRLHALGGSLQCLGILPLTLLIRVDDRSLIDIRFI